MSTGMAQVVRLRVPTFISHCPQPEHLPGCVDPYTCTCVPHTLDREQAVARGRSGGVKRHDTSKCRVVRCWKCGSIWSNWEETRHFASRKSFRP